MLHKTPFSCYRLKKSKRLTRRVSFSIKKRRHFFLQCLTSQVHGHDPTFFIQQIHFEFPSRCKSSPPDIPIPLKKRRIQEMSFKWHLPTHLSCRPTTPHISRTLCPYIAHKQLTSALPPNTAHTKMPRNLAAHTCSQ